MVAVNGARRSRPASSAQDRLKRGPRPRVGGLTPETHVHARGLDTAGDGVSSIAETLTSRTNGVIRFAVQRAAAFALTAAAVF